VHKSRVPVHGYKAHIAADKDTGLIREVETTAANEADVTIAPSIIPDAPGEVYGDKTYDALSVEMAIKAKGGTSKLMRKGHRWLPAEKLEAHNRPLRPVRSRIEKIFGTWKRSYHGSGLPKPNSKSISRRLLTTSNAFGACKARERSSKTSLPPCQGIITALDADLVGRGHPTPLSSPPPRQLIFAEEDHFPHTSLASRETFLSGRGRKPYMAEDNGLSCNLVRSIGLLVHLPRRLPNGIRRISVCLWIPMERLGLPPTGIQALAMLTPV
jgi:Transposase DDE domain